MTSQFQFQPHHDADKDLNKQTAGQDSGRPFGQKQTFGTHTFGQSSQPASSTGQRFGSTTDTHQGGGTQSRPAFGSASQTGSSFGSAAGGTRSAFGTTSGTQRPAFGSTSQTGSSSSFGTTRPAFGGTSQTGSSSFGQNRPAFGSASRTGSSSFGQNRPAFGSTPQSPRPSFRPASSSGTPSFQPHSTTLHHSSPLSKDASLTDEEFHLLRDFIYKQCGIYIAENRKYLVENRLSARIKELNLKNYTEYYKYLKFDVNKDAELNKLFVLVTTNETSFFRNPPQLQIFQDVVLTNILNDLRASNQRKLRIWSAGCSTGEEPYTLAIIIADLLRTELHSWDIKITANDLSTQVLQAAREGIYNEYTLRTTPKEFISRYFNQEGKVYRIKDELKRMISFGQINLSNREQLKHVERSHIVFCRNVIIYFDDDMKRKVINAFYDNLLPGGALLIGHSETLHNICRSFELEHYTGAIVYRKK